MTKHAFPFFIVGVVALAAIIAGCTAPQQAQWFEAKSEKLSCSVQAKPIEKTVEYLLVTTTMDNVKVCDPVNASYRVSEGVLYVDFHADIIEDAKCAQCASGQQVTAHVPLNAVQGVPRVTIMHDGKAVSHHYVSDANPTDQPFELHYSFMGGLMPYAGSIDINGSKAIVRWQDFARSGSEEEYRGEFTLTEGERSRIIAALRKGFLNGQVESLPEPPCCDRIWVTLNATVGSDSASVQTAEDLLFEKVSGYTELKDEFDLLFARVKSQGKTYTVDELITKVKIEYPDVAFIEACDGRIGCSTDITWQWQPADGSYLLNFYNGSGDCPAGCINRQFRWFTAWVDGRVRFENSTSNDLVVESGSG